MVCFFPQDARVRRGKREKRPTDPRARQEEQPMGGKGQVHNHVTRPNPETTTAKNQQIKKKQHQSTTNQTTRR